MPPFQPFAAQIRRLLVALDAVGTPLPAADTGALKAALNATEQEQHRALHTIITTLDRHVLFEATLNPEMRVSVSRGSAPAELVQGGWRNFLVKVSNQAGTSPALRFKSPQAAPVGRISSLAITGVHDFTNGATDEVEARERWLGLDTYVAAPLTPTLSGLDLEYRIIQLYSRDSGEREATLQADAGFGDEDLGYRSSLPILFRCSPARAVWLEILDEKAAPSVAALCVTDSLGRVYPPKTKRSMPDLNFQPQVYRYNGEDLFLPEGTYDVSYTRGPEYLLQTQQIDVSEHVQPLSLHLKRWISPAAYGYYSGDTHIHAAGCSHYESPTEGVTPLVMERQVDGEALDLGAVLNWGPGFEYQKQFFSGHVEPMDHAHHKDALAPHAGMPHDAEAIARQQDSDIVQSLQHTTEAPAARSLVRYDVEVSGFPSSHCGHLVLLQLRDQHFPGTRVLDDWPSWNGPILKWAKSQGAHAGYAHSAHGLVVDSTLLPNLVMPPFNSMGANEFIADVTHPGLVDFISGCDLWPFAELNIWYHTLNCGYMTSFAGETDFPCLADVQVGGGRSYVALRSQPEGDAGYSGWLDALLRGSSYFGDGRSHLFWLAVNGQRRTSEPLKLAGPAVIEITAEVCARLEPESTEVTRAIQHASPYSKPYWHIERARVGATRRVPVELVVNGIAVSRVEVEADAEPHKVHFQAHLERSSWVALRIYPSSHTNPIAVIIDGQPLRASHESALWCRRAVDVCWAQKAKRIRPEELQAAAAHYEHARLAFDRIVLESSN